MSEGQGSDADPRGRGGSVSIPVFSAIEEETLPDVEQEIQVLPTLTLLDYPPLTPTLLRWMLDSPSERNRARIHRSEGFLLSGIRAACRLHACLEWELGL